MPLNAYLLVLLLVCSGVTLKCVAPPCDQHMFDSNADNCLTDFSKSLETIRYQDSCPWPVVKTIYSKLKHCVDSWATASCCMRHGSLLDKAFLKVHNTYFSLCGQVYDPPLTTLIMLIAPVTIATLLLPLLFINHLTNTKVHCTLGL